MFASIMDGKLGRLRSLARDKRARSLPLMCEQHKSSTPKNINLLPPVETAPSLVDTVAADGQLEFRRVLHLVRQLERHLQTSVCLAAVTADDLVRHAAVQSTIEQLVHRLAALRDQLSSSRGRQVPETDTGDRVEPVQWRRVETRLHHCWLQSLERRLVIEEILRGHIPPMRFLDEESRRSLHTPPVDEPVLKCRKLTNLNSPNMENNNSPVNLHLDLKSTNLNLKSTSNSPNSISQDVGYASESSMHLSTDDISPCQPASPPFADNNILITTPPKRKAELSNSDLNHFILKASPEDFYYKVAPYDLKSKHPVKVGNKLAFSEDEEQSYQLRKSRQCFGELEEDFSTTKNKLRETRTEEKTHLLTAKCEPSTKKKLRKKKRPWSLILNENGGFSGMKNSVSDDGGHLLRNMERNVVPRRVWSSSEEEELKSGEEENGSRRTLIFDGKENWDRKEKFAGVKSKSTSAIGAQDLGEVESSLWEDYWDAPYSSEAYSEKSVDESLVQRMTNFGEDYSVVFPADEEDGLEWNLRLISSRRKLARLSSASSKEEDSNSSAELQSVLLESKKQLETIRQNAQFQPDLKMVCQTNIQWLSAIATHFAASSSQVFHRHDKNLVEELLCQWTVLRGEICESQKVEADDENVDKSALWTGNGLPDLIPDGRHKHQTETVPKTSAKSSLTVSAKQISSEYGSDLMSDGFSPKDWRRSGICLIGGPVLVLLVFLCLVLVGVFWQPRCCSYGSRGGLQMTLSYPAGSPPI